MARRTVARRPPHRGGGLLPEDHSDIKIVPDEDREWWAKLPREAKVRVAERYRKRWSDDETLLLVQADPDTADYYTLGAQMGRTPGSLRWRRSLMIHLLKDEYGWAAKAKAYVSDPKRNHKYADVGQMHAVMKKLGMLELPVSVQFELARHLKQPKAGWRGDNTSAVLRVKRERVDILRARIANAVQQRKAAAPDA